MAQNFAAGPNDATDLPDSDYHQVQASSMAGEDFTTITKDIMLLAEAHNVSLSKAARHVIEPDKESDPDVITDILERRGIVLASGAYGPSTPTEEIFHDRELTALAVEYVQEAFFKQIHDADFFAVGTPQQHVAFAGSGMARGDLPTEGNAFNPPTIVPVAPTKVLYQDVEIADIIGMRQEIVGSRATQPEIEEPDEWKLTNIAEFGEIPKFRMKTGEALTEIMKAGYAHEASYELLRSPGETIEALSQFSEWLAFNATRDIVNEGLQLAFNGATAYNTGAATLDRESGIKMLAQRKKGTQFNFICGNLDFFAKYASTDFTFNSNNSAPLTYDRGGARTFLNSPMGQQQITYRDGTEVAALSGTDPIGGLIDKRFVLIYFFEKNSNIEEMDMDRSHQFVSFYRTFSYQFSLRPMADEARVLATIQA